MRRIGRYILNALTALSLLLLIGVCALWTLSYRHGDLVEYNELDESFRQFRKWQAWSRQGGILLLSRHDDLSNCSRDLLPMRGWPEGWKFYRYSPSILGLEPWDALRGVNNSWTERSGQAKPVGWYRYGMGHFHGTTKWTGARPESTQPGGAARSPIGSSRTGR